MIPSLVDPSHDLIQSEDLGAPHQAREHHPRLGRLLLGIADQIEETRMPDISRGTLEMMSTVEE
jgi:hypothetical protein